LFRGLTGVTGIERGRDLGTRRFKGDWLDITD